MSGHEPQETTTSAVTVTCAASGPQVDWSEAPAWCATLADLEAFCAALRAHGAGDDTAVPRAVGLSVRLDLMGPA